MTATALDVDDDWFQPGTFTAQCPARNFHLSAEPLRRISKDQYECGCGCVFDWTGTYRWTVITPCPLLSE